MSSKIDRIESELDRMNNFDKFDKLELMTKNLHELTDNEIEKLITLHYKEAQRARNVVNIVNALIAEQASRQSNKTATESIEIANESKEISKRSSITSKISIGVAIGALLISFTALIIDYLGDIKWQNDQLKLLNEIKIVLERNEKTKNIVQQKQLPNSKEKINK